jgi:hypothetical protein
MQPCPQLVRRQLAVRPALAGHHGTRRRDAGDPRDADQLPWNAHGA